MKVVHSRGVWKHDVNVYIGFIKTKLYRSQNSKTENTVSAVRFSKTDRDPYYIDFTSTL